MQTAAQTRANLDLLKTFGGQDFFGFSLRLPHFRHCGLHLVSHAMSTLLINFPSSPTHLDTHRESEGLGPTAGDRYMLDKSQRISASPRTSASLCNLHPWIGNFQKFHATILIGMKTQDLQRFIF